LLVLVDGDTASAAEVLVAALMCHRRAAVAGSRTVGKDVAQAVVALRHGAGLALTVRAYCDPHGLDLACGILPDFNMGAAGWGSRTGSRTGSGTAIRVAHVRLVVGSGRGQTPTSAPTVGNTEPVPVLVPLSRAKQARSLMARVVSSKAVGEDVKIVKCSAANAKMAVGEGAEAWGRAAEAEAEAMRCAGGMAVWSVENVLVWAGKGSP
jgi:hypothetical protein